MTAPLDLLMFAAACALLIAGYPVAFTLAGVGLAFAALGAATGQFDPILLRLLPNRVYAIMVNQTLLAVPLFVFMGVVLERSRVAEELLEAMSRLIGRFPGGMGVAVVLVGGLLAASTGIVGATVVTLGLLALPTMLKRGAPAPLAAGAVCASGTLGQIIPPSIALILLGDVMSNAYQEAQRAAGVFSPDVVSVGDIFAGALIPGALLVAMYAAFLVGAAAFGFGGDGESEPADHRHDLSRIMKAMLPPLGLIIAVLGSILAGAATPTEAASVGAVGALLLAGLRAEGGATGAARILIFAALAGAALASACALSFDMRLDPADPRAWIAGGGGALTAIGAAAAAWRLLKLGVLSDMTGSAAETTAMVFAILIGATIFSLVFRGLGGDETVTSLLENTPGGMWGALALVMAIVFALGFFLDFIEITFVVVPTVAPALIGLGADPIWLAVLLAVNLQTSFLTPPFGFALFYLRGVAPDSVSTGQIYRGVIPFVALQLLALTLVAAAPPLATWLPSVLR